MRFQKHCENYHENITKILPNVLPLLSTLTYFLLVMFLSVFNCTPDKQRKLGVHELQDPPGDCVSLQGADEHRGGAEQPRQDERVQGEPR